MTTDIYSRIVDFICETRYNDTVSFYGPEVNLLANSYVIRRICTGLNERSVPFKSNMINDASLMTKELTHEVKELWKLKNIKDIT